MMHEMIMATLKTTLISERPKGIKLDPGPPTPPLFPPVASLSIKQWADGCSANGAVAGIQAAGAGAKDRRLTVRSTPLFLCLPFCLCPYPTHLVTSPAFPASCGPVGQGEGSHSEGHG